jgi:argininosuccinate lyase
MKMWGGRFKGDTDPRFLEFTRSLDFDRRLYPYDLACTGAWVWALAAAGVLTSEEETSIRDALERVGLELGSGSFDFVPTDEDIHTAVERRVIEIAGPAGGKIRTGRSRNDQVATDLRLYSMEACGDAVSRARELQGALVEKADENIDIAVPGHTHLQQAQPVLLAHILLAFVQMLERDVARLQTARRRADCMPLGSGALAGTGYDIDREGLAARLGFSRVSDNSVDAVSDRDFACELLFALAMTMIHLSRLAEQVILWCSQEFGLAELDDAWSTGSSLMPQKKNPDGPELVRAKSGRVTGGLLALLMVVKALPLAYNRDLQEDKEPLFDAVDTTRGSLEVMAGTLSSLKFNGERAAELLDSGFITATDLADCLVESGVPFPRAHEIAGGVVSDLLRNGRGLEDLTDDELRTYSGLFRDGSAEKLSVEASLARRCVHGGTAREEVANRIREARSMIERPAGDADRVPGQE